MPRRSLAAPLALAAVLLIRPAAAQLPPMGPMGPPIAGEPGSPSPARAPQAPGKASDAAKTKAKASEPQKPLPRGAVLEEVAGTVAELDRAKHRLVIETAAGPVVLRLDRNSLVYGPRGLTTVLDLTPGAHVRAGRNADFLAYWVQLRAPPPPPTSTPGQGTGPGGAAGPPAERTATPNGGKGPGTDVGPGSEAPGPGGPSSAGPSAAGAGR